MAAARSVRIGAGSLKGRRLLYPQEARFRPTMQRVKESVFARIGSLLPGRVFVDLFCAGGGVGIEALSRGARFVHFVDASPRALFSVRRNLERCGVDPSCYRIHRSPVESWLRGGADPPGEILYADPPYGEGYGELVVELLSRQVPEGLLLVVVEERGPLEAPAEGGLVKSAEASFGDTVVSFFQPKGE